MSSEKQQSTTTTTTTTTATTGNNKQPEWLIPVTNDDNNNVDSKQNMETTSTTPVLKLYNSLTRTKVPFIPKSSDEVTWYSCGPTVYNSSHMGHARNYVTIDMNRRILQDYFGYNVKFIQNVTDIDDKIIIRARQEYLFEKFSKEFINNDDDDDKKINKNLINKSNESLKYYIEKNLQKDYSINNSIEFKEWVKKININEEKLRNPKLPMHIKSIELSLNAIENFENYTIENFLESTKDIIVPLLDKELGSTITDPTIFRNTAAFWENNFDNDMKRLNVLPPTITTRVSEYIPEIIEFVEKIVSNGFGYQTSDGSVYFNSGKFDKDPNHDYAKLQPWNKGDMDLIEDGEGSLSTNVGGKLNPADFALWKSSKPGEPFWDSPWGQGRPGWHIECSVMASDFVGENMDIHSGGIDLAFPHHDNELAQSEAHFGCKQWVNYFLHTGHLHIEGQKMSKSLKNFITIDEALDKYSSRQLRLCFALVQWNNPLDFKESLLQEVKNSESTLNNFFKNIRALKSDYEHKISKSELISKKLTILEKNLIFKDLKKYERQINLSFCDNLSTPLVIRSILELIAITNTYISNIGSEIKIEPLLQICQFITKILRVLGFNIRQDNLGWLEEEEQDNETGNGNKEDIIMPYVKVLSNFRDLVRKVAINKEDYKILLETCDEIRDKDLIELNISLDDRSDNQGALIKFLNNNEKLELIKQQEEKQKLIEAKLAKKLQQLKLKEKENLIKFEKSKISPFEMFKINEYKNIYSEWDNETGLPIKLINGEEVTKSAKKKLVKLYEQQKKLHDEYLKNQSK
ncbi:cysteine-tRNA ligase activity protein [[Candida] boidinii]|nr:cysteine-tRNA ligase activity protein [[Candida] boidinii]GME91427.1 unnamed protein product [[Candida] boidinii]